MSKTDLNKLAKKMNIELGKDKTIEGISFAFGLSEKEINEFILKYQKDEEWIKEFVKDELNKGYYGMFGGVYDHDEESYMEINEIEDYDDLTDEMREEIYLDTLAYLEEYVGEMEEDIFIENFRVEIMKYKGWKGKTNRFILRPTEAFFGVDDATYVKFNIENEKGDKVYDGELEWYDNGMYCNFNDDLSDYFMPETDSIFGNDIIKFEELREANEEFNKFVEEYNELYNHIFEVKLNQYENRFYEKEVKGNAFVEALKKADLNEIAEKMLKGSYYDDTACAGVGGKPTSIEYVKGETDIKVAKDILYKWIGRDVNIGYDKWEKDGEIYHSAGWRYDDFAYDNISITLEA
jgi:hypothetical protein